MSPIQSPAGLEFVEAVGVAVDSKNRVFVFGRGPKQLQIYSAAGEFLEAWDDTFERPHGITIAPDDTVYLTDDFGHGTAVTGTIVATGNNGIGVAGVAFGSRVLPVKVMGPTGYAALRSGDDAGAAYLAIAAANRGPIVTSHGQQLRRCTTMGTLDFGPWTLDFAASRRACAMASYTFRRSTNFTSKCTQRSSSQTTSGESGEPANCWPRRAI